MTEEEKVQAAADLADAVYFLHGHSKAVVHGGVNISSVMIDGETHRAKLVSRHAIDRIAELCRWRKAAFMALDSHLDEDERGHYQEIAPETLLRDEPEDAKSDIWSAGATIAEFLFEIGVWDEHALFKQFVGVASRDAREAIKQAMLIKQEPSIVKTLKSANARLHFLESCFFYNPQERPAATFITRGLQQCVMEIQRESRTQRSQISSFIFPGRRITNSARMRQFDPLIRQQIEWNVRNVS